MADNKDKKVLNVPALRFPEFSGEWEKCVLTEIVERVTRRNKGNVCKLPLTISAQYGLVDQITFFNKVIASADMSNYYLLTKGDFAYNKSYSSEYPWGAIKRLDRYEYGALSSLYICFRPLSHVSSDFLMHYFETKKWHQGVSEIAVEGARNHGLLNIGIQDFFATSHYMPQELSEQKKIAAFLNLIEKRISVQNKIIEDLKKLKSAIYQEMFGSLVAQTLKLGQVAEVVKGKQVNGTELLEQGAYYVMNGGTLPSGWLNKYNTEANTISISEGGNSCGYVQYNTSPYWSGGHCYSLKILHPQETSDLYLYHFLKWQEENIMALRIGSGLPNIQKKDLLHFPVILPTITQQNKIVLILSAIEEKVSCEISITQYFVKQKEYLLSQLFI